MGRMVVRREGVGGCQPHCEALILILFGAGLVLCRLNPPLYPDPQPTTTSLATPTPPSLPPTRREMNLVSLQMVSPAVQSDLMRDDSKQQDKEERK